MKEHHLKTWPHEFDAVRSGAKTFEVRSNADRDFDVGDWLYLHKWDPGSKSPIASRGQYITPEGHGWHEQESADTIIAEVTYILHGGRFHLAPGVCVMAITVIR